jgi:hypothetical protein
MRRDAAWTRLQSGKETSRDGDQIRLAAGLMFFRFRLPPAMAVQSDENPAVTLLPRHNYSIGATRLGRSCHIRGDHLIVDHTPPPRTITDPSSNDSPNLCHGTP